MLLSKGEQFLNLLIGDGFQKFLEDLIRKQGLLSLSKQMEITELIDKKKAR